jgi:hypothetical protein
MVHTRFGVFGENFNCLDVVDVFSSLALVNGK